MYKELKTELHYLLYFLGYDDMSKTRSNIFLLCLCILCVKLSSQREKIELQSLIANKIGKFLAIIMNITFYRKKIAIVSQKA